MKKNKPLSIIDLQTYENASNIYSNKNIIVEDKGNSIVIKLCGCIEPKGDCCISVETLCETVKNIKQETKKVVLVWDSPGGSVENIQSFLKVVEEKQQQGIKFVSIADPLCCSAAYWLASNSDMIYLSSKTSRVGSIGVVATHVETSVMEEQAGIKTTEIVAGKYKRADSQHKPLGIEGRVIIQSQVDYVYSLFVDDVSKNRGIPVEVMLGDVADGRIYIGEQAIQNGLVDGIANVDDVLNMENDMLQKNTNKIVTSVGAVEEPTDMDKIKEEPTDMDKIKEELDMLKKENEELKEKLKQYESKKDEAEKAVIAERQRISALEDIAPVNCGALLQQAKSEGWSVEKASVEFLKNVKANVNSLRGETTAVPTLVGEVSDMAKRIADAANKRR